MARPQRIRDAEQNGGEIEVLDRVDSQGEAAEAVKSGSVDPERELELSRSVAKRMGWTPQDEWKRDPSKWVDAPDFLANTPAEISALKERSKRTAQAAEAAIEESRRQARIEAQAEVRAAAEAGDPERVIKAAEKVANVSGPDQRTVAWVARNAWFNSDPAAAAVARTEVESAAKRGLSFEEQLDAAETQVKRRFPEHFGVQRTEPEAEKGEVRLSEVRQAPVVEGGSRGGSKSKKEPGFEDIPAPDRALYKKHFEKRGIKPENYARSYWANKGD